MTYREPPAGWVSTGMHAGPDFCSYAGPLEFSAETDEALMPLWERHNDCPLIDDDPDSETCLHLEEYGRVQKFDGGRLPVLCGRCYTVLQYRGEGQPTLTMRLDEQ